MGAIRSTENKTERLLRSALHKRGLRFRKYDRRLPGHPDIVFPGARVVVFVDGDYWHGRVLQEQGLMALKRSIRKRASHSYWLAKFQRNFARDREATAGLRNAGWHVLRLWESDVKRDIEANSARIFREVQRRKAQAL